MKKGIYTGIETKFKIKNPGEFRKRLKTTGPEFISRNFEHDIYYNSPKKGLLFTPLEKAADFNRWPLPIEGDSGFQLKADPPQVENPPSPQTVRERDSLTGFTVRLRIINRKEGVFTLKLAVSEKSSRHLKILREWETSIGTPEIFKSILEKLGFSFYREKIRETYHFNKVLICLDQTPFIGWYAEIEDKRN